MIAASGFFLQRRSREAGFTYLWLLLVVALMGLGFASVLELHQTTVRRDKETQLLWIGRQYVTALESYRDSSGRAGATAQAASASRPFDQRQFPTTLEELLKDSRFPGIKRHLRTIYIDPMTGKREWGLLRRENRIMGVYSLSADRPIKQAAFELGQESFQDAEQYSSWVFAPPVSVQPTIPAADTRMRP